METKAKVVKAFHHTNTGKTWLAGDVFSGDESTVAELARRGFLAASEPNVTVAISAEGFESEPDFGALTVKELSALCADRGIDVPAKARKAELVAALQAAGEE